MRKILLFILKCLTIICTLLAFLLTLVSVVLSIIALTNISYSSIFVYSFMVLLGMATISSIFVYVAFNYVYNRKQPYKKIIIISICSLLVFATGGCLLINKAKSINIVDSMYNLDLVKEEILIDENKIEKGMILDFTTSSKNVDVIIDDNVEGIKVVIEHPQSVSTKVNDYWGHYSLKPIEGESHTVQFSFENNKNLIEIFDDIRKDLKNGCFRQTYSNAYSMVKIKVMLSKETLDSIKIIYWGNDK